MRLRLSKPRLAAIVVGLALLTPAIAQAVLPAPGGGGPAIAYVALGDSYSAGEGLPPFLSGTATSTDRCHRSASGYPFLVSSFFGAVPFHDFACSGATTLDVDSRTQYKPEGKPQARKAPLGKADLVTITIGGNDIDFSGDLSHCGEPWHRACQNDKSFTQGVARSIAALPGDLDSAYGAIREHIRKRATVMVLGYPQLFPERTAAENCHSLRGFPGVEIFSDGEQQYFNARADQVNGIVKAAAKRAGFFYISAIAAFRGHAHCDGVEYLNGVTAPNGYSISAGDGSFHPNSAGQREYATLVESRIDGYKGKRNKDGLPRDPKPTLSLAPPPRCVQGKPC